jgi:hypothetical protein
VAAPVTPVVRAILTLLALALLGMGAVLGYIALVALRRSEGVFMPAGYVALALLAGGAYLLRLGVRG